MDSSQSKDQVAKRLVCQTRRGLSICGGKELKMEDSARDRKRNSARKKSDFSVYSQKAVRATELRQSKENTRVVQDKQKKKPKNSK